MDVGGGGGAASRRRQRRIPPTYEQWLEELCDLGLLVVDIDEYLDEIMDE